MLVDGVGMAHGVSIATDGHRWRGRITPNGSPGAAAGRCGHGSARSVRGGWSAGRGAGVRRPAARSPGPGAAAPAAAVGEDAARDPHEGAARVVHDPPELREHPEAQALGPGMAQLGIEGHRLQQLEQVEGDHLEAEPGGVRAVLREG